MAKLVCDVCVICALPEEARAFLEVVERHCNVPFEKLIDPHHHYDYRLATIKTNEDEPLSIHVSWLPRYGPLEMTLHLSYVLEECQPRIAIMTGICAGDVQQVQLGDLVVAERTFTYDNGKFILDDEGRIVHQRDTMTYQLNAALLQFLALFEDWKPFVSRLKRPSPLPKSRMKRRGIQCHLKPIASGSAVRADHPFAEVRAPVYGTVAIDMESAAFGLVMSRHPQIPWLVVKGVCDYADENKNDAYHHYAARASALYALSFIRAYVTKQRLPGSRYQKSWEGQEPRDMKNIADLRDVLGMHPHHRSFTQEDAARDVSAPTIRNRELDKTDKAPVSVQQKVFISYSHKDAKWLELLRVQHTPLEREGIIDLWDDTKIVAGAQWKKAISEALETASVAITLVSANFLASDFIARYELPHLLARAADGGTLILPIILSPCLFHETGLKVFQTVNSPDKSLSAMKSSDREQVWVKVAEAIRKRLIIDAM